MPVLCPRHLSVLGAVVLLTLACGAPAAPPAAPAPAGAAPTPAAGAAPPSAAAPTAGALTKYTIGRIGNATFHSPFYISVNKGFLREQGLDPEIVVLPTPQQIAGLVSGSLNVSVSSTDAVVLAVAHGQSLRQVMGYQSKWPYNFIAAAQYQRIEDLRGKQIGVEGINVSTGRLTELLLKRYGMERGRDWEAVVDGNNPDRYAALTNGSIAATMLGDPYNFQAIDQGYTNLGSVEDLLPQMDFQDWTVDRDAAQRGAQSLVAFMKGMLKTYQWLYDPANKEELVRFYEDEFKLTPQIAEQAYEANIPGKMWDENGRPNRAAIQALIDDMRSDNAFQDLPIPTIDQIVDETYLQQAWSQLGIQP
ncbi:MAG TPA: ABC transporter substrate-binding protein [Chloroflexota bacterium]|nr:ABC transporter substrate-binding protein [Chloroflexota bacterium]